MANPFEITLDHCVYLYLLCGAPDLITTSRTKTKEIHPPHWNNLTVKYGRAIWKEVSTNVFKALENSSDKSEEQPE